MFTIKCSFKFLLGTLILLCTFGAVSALATKTFSNTNTIAIPVSGSSGVASPYPSYIDVSGVNGWVTNVSVTLHDFYHTFPDDVVVILVGPQGDQVSLMMDSGSGTDASGLTLTFDDGAALPIPSDGPLSSGTFKPNQGAGVPSGACSPMPAPYPSGDYGNALSVYTGKDPNGDWSLYVCDESGGDFGAFEGGWSLHIEGASSSFHWPMFMPAITGADNNDPPR